MLRRGVRRITTDAAQVQKVIITVVRVNVSASGPFSNYVRSLLDSSLTGMHGAHPSSVLTGDLNAAKVGQISQIRARQVDVAGPLVGRALGTPRMPAGMQRQQAEGRAP